MTHPLIQKKLDEQRDADFTTHLSGPQFRQAQSFLTTALQEALIAGQQSPKVGFLRQYLNECGKFEKAWADEDILAFLRIPFKKEVMEGRKSV